MPREIIMPALGMAQDTGLIVSWLKSPGDAVKSGDALFEVETDKAVVEVEATADGYLTNVQAEAGTDVPVGQVIALISETAEDTASAPNAPRAATEVAPQQDALPKGADVIMPALGMAQDTGLIVAWHKAPGDAVAAGDILFEVETDKSTVEVEAGQDGFVAALLAEAGEEAPVGDVIAIISADKPDAPVQRSVSGAKAAPDTVSQPTPAKPVAAPKAPAAKPAAAIQAGGRILASPKARRLALEEGLDLARLVGERHPQPFHVSDLDILRAMPDAAPAPLGQMTATRHLTAQVTDGFAAFAEWASDAAGLTDVSALLAGLAGRSLGREDVVVVERFGQLDCYQSGATLGKTTQSEAAPDLYVRDMRGSALRGIHLGPEDTPVLTLTGGDKDELTITLECSADQLSATEALTLLSNFASRIEQPIRHLL